MKTEDIDKRIGMPDVDKEWARFEQEVIGKEAKAGKNLWLWGLSIAASIIIVAGLFLLNHDSRETEQLLKETSKNSISHEVVEPSSSEKPAELIAKTSQPKKIKENRKGSTVTDYIYVSTATDNTFDCDEENAVFPGGEEALFAFIKANLKLPNLAIEYGAKGRIFTSFVIDSVGEVSDIRILERPQARISYDTPRLSQEPEDTQVKIKELIALQLGEEATRILSLMPRWRPAIWGGKPTKTRHHLPIIFEATKAEQQKFLAKNLASESVDQALQEQIAGLDIVPNSSYLGNGTTMRLRGLGDSVIDQIGKTDSFLVVVNGKTLFDSRGMTSEEIDRRINEYLKEQGLLQDIKIPCNNGAIVIKASTQEERKELQRMIANLTIVPKLPHLGSGTTMRLRGTGDGPNDKDRIDSTLILVNGEPLPDSLKHKIMGNDMDDIDTYMPRYFSQQGLMIDSVYVLKDSEFTEKYGGLAKYGVIEIKTVPDTYCDAYVRKHPKLKKKYQRVEGYVFDNNGKPLTEAWVHVKRERAVLKKHPELDLVGAATDSTGHYVLWLPKDADIMLRAEQAGYKSFEFSPSDKDIVTHHLEKTYNMRLRGNPEPTAELQGQIAGLPPISDIRKVKHGYRRPTGEMAPDTILTLVNGKEDEALLPYLWKNPYWSRTFIYDYFFERNQLFIRQYRPEGDEINKYTHLFNGRDIRFILDYQSRPYKPVGQFTPDELKARRLAYLLHCYQEGGNSRNYGGMLAPDLFDTPAEERLFGLLGVKYWHGNRFEKFGHVSRDSQGIYIPLERYTELIVQDEIWQENGEWLGMEDDERFNAVIKELDEAANEASSSLVEPSDSVVAMAFIYGGKVTKGAPHESSVKWVKPLKEKVKESTFEFTPDEDAPSYWTAEIYYSTQFPRYMVVLLRSVDKLYASECPDILGIHYKRLTGVVEDEEGKPVSGALVSYRERPYFSDHAATDSLGRFELMLPNTSDTISVIRIGYEKQTIRVLPTDSVLTIRMKEIDWSELRESFKNKQK